MPEFDVLEVQLDLPRWHLEHEMAKGWCKAVAGWIMPRAEAST